MKKGISYLEGKHDFKAFTAKKNTKKSTVRTIHEIQMEQVGEELVFTFYGDGFLYHMVRILTGTLVDVAYQKTAPCEIESITASKDRFRAGQTAPAAANRTNPRLENIFSSMAAYYTLRALSVSINKYSGVYPFFVHYLCLVMLREVFRSASMRMQRACFPIDVAMKYCDAKTLRKATRKLRVVRFGVKINGWDRISSVW